MKKFLFLLFPVFILSSCSVIDSPKRFAGISTQKFDNEEKGRFSQDFELSKKEAFNKSLSVLKQLRARVTYKSYKKGLITAFDFAKTFDYCLDSTEAALLIEEIGGNSVKITVICNNSLLARHLSEKFFEMIPLNPQDAD